MYGIYWESPSSPTTRLAITLIYSHFILSSGVQRSEGLFAYSVLCSLAVGVPSTVRFLVCSHDVRL